MISRLAGFAALLVVVTGSTLLIARPQSGAPVAGSVDADTVLVLVGEFKPHERDGKGRAAVFQLPNGQLLVRLSEFSTVAGGDVRVYLLGASEVGSRAQLDRAGFVDLGPLRLPRGDQVYLVPVNTPLSRVRAIAIWDRRGEVNFASAVLRRP